MKGKTKKIVLTGGHGATTALATIEEIIRREEGAEIYWIGVKKAMEGKNVASLGSSISSNKQVTFKPIIAGRIQRKFTLWTIPSLIRIPFGFFHALYLLISIKPKVILSFGGYAAFPLVFWGKLFGIPVVIHEQTVKVGRANKLSSMFATSIALARKSSKKFFPKKKVKITGNPILTQILEVEPKLEANNPPTIYITGGSRGSVFINSLVKESLRKLLGKYSIIHQTGEFEFSKYEKIKSELTDYEKERYEVYGSIDPMMVDGVYKKSDFVIGRAGASTVSEIIATKRPSILIPIPWSYANEQMENAKYAKAKGISEILEQSEATAEKLISMVEELTKNRSKMITSSKDSDDRQASSNLVDLLETYL